VIELTKEIVSVIFGLTGTFILFYSQILSYKHSYQDEKRYLLISQIIGYLFLFNSFIYLLSGVLFQIKFSILWPYLMYSISGVYISLKMVREIKVTTGKKEVAVAINNDFESWIFFYIPMISSIFAVAFNFDFIIIINFIAWFKFNSWIPRK
jgi:hypothetical protein